MLEETVKTVFSQEATSTSEENLHVSGVLR